MSAPPPEPGGPQLPLLETATEDKRSLDEIPLVTPEGDEEEAVPAGREGVEGKDWALCLSGGGYRAMLFHLGSLWRLNELGYLPKLDRISSVSGGSITAATLAIHWADLDFDERGVAHRFEEEIVRPLRTLAGKTLDVRSILRGIVSRGSVSDRVAAAYRKYLLGDAILQDLPDRPRFVFNATNVQSGALWRFSKPYMGDYRVGRVFEPRLPLAEAVAASTAFPPLLSPHRIQLRDQDFAHDPTADLRRPPFTTQIFLTDGGVYDNLGLETAWKSHANVLVSDAGGKMQPDPTPATNWPRHAIRVNEIMEDQVRSLRKRQLISAYQAGVRGGAYWGIRTDMANFGLADALPAPVGRTLELAATPTRLAKTPKALQEKLINWGYAVTDAAMRRHVDSDLPPPEGFPYPKVGVG